uniref:N-acetyltransferase domain-containing protein n=1 Tax=Astyanax mexicanus TaxID=7994 RepID=A0A3B1JNN0_ASTMX
MRIMMKKDVKEIFTLGLHGLLRSFCMHVLKQLHIQVLLVCVFCALLASTKSLLLPILAVTLLLAVGRQGKHPSDYLEKPYSCFWVAESQGRVVGTVACRPMEMNGGSLELRRVSVRLSHRGQASVKKQGLPAVVLTLQPINAQYNEMYKSVINKKNVYVKEYVRNCICLFMFLQYSYTCCKCIRSFWI